MKLNCASVYLGSCQDWTDANRCYFSILSSYLLLNQLLPSSDLSSLISPCASCAVAYLSINVLVTPRMSLHTHTPCNRTIIPSQLYHSHKLVTILLLRRTSTHAISSYFCCTVSCSHPSIISRLQGLPMPIILHVLHGIKWCHSFHTAYKATEGMRCEIVRYSRGQMGYTVSYGCENGLDENEQETIRGVGCESEMTLR